ncbi:MAG: hypothetical protein GY841_16560 [FCB group bacterium]|nr:hypothetical protein [FCB group bacterium]
MAVVAMVKRVLLMCNSPLMADHLSKFAAIFDDDRIKFYAAFVGRDDCIKRSKSILKIPDICDPHDDLPLDGRFQWDLIVIADHMQLPWHPTQKAPPPVLFIGHGAQGKRQRGSKYPYGYDPRHTLDALGKPKYKCMFDVRPSDVEAGVKLVPKLKKVVKAVGSQHFDELLDYRKLERLSSSDRPTVFILSSWGRSSLIRRLGYSLINECKRLDYDFYVSIHPNEYNGDGWGHKVELQGLAVRRPDEPLGPYLAASDVVVCDHTSLCQSAALMRKPIIFIKTDESLICPGSITRRLYDLSLKLVNVNELKAVIEAMLAFRPWTQYDHLLGKIHPLAGQYERLAKREFYKLLKIRGK